MLRKMLIFRSAADGSDRCQDCRREQPITSPRAERSVCATNCKNFARQTPDTEHVTELEKILASVHVVDPPDASSDSVTIGAMVVKDKKGD